MVTSLNRPRRRVHQLTASPSHRRLERGPSVPACRSGRRDAGVPLPLSFSDKKRIHQLEATVQELTKQLHQEHVKAIVDLRVAAGLIPAGQRRQSVASTSKLNDQVLEIVRKELVEILARLNTIQPRDESNIMPRPYIG